MDTSSYFDSLDANALGLRSLGQAVNSGYIVSFAFDGAPFGSAIVDNPELADTLSALVEMSKQTEGDKKEIKALQDIIYNLRAQLDAKDATSKRNSVIKEKFEELQEERDRLLNELAESQGEIEFLKTHKEVELESLEIMSDFVASARESQQFKKYMLRRAVTMIESMKADINEQQVMSGWEVIQFLDKCSKQVRAEAAAGKF